MSKKPTSTAKSADTRGARRHRLSLEATVHAHGAGGLGVLIANISETGCLIELQDINFADTDISIEIHGLDIDAIDARVTWRGDGAFGCVFEEPLSAATVSAARLRGDPPSGPPSAETNWAERLVEARQRLALSASGLARELGVSRPTLWSWETGRGVPSVENASRVEQWLAQSEPVLPTVAKSGKRSSRVETLRAEVARELGVDPDDIDISLKL